MFDAAQQLLAQAALRYTPEFMLEAVARRVLEEHELCRPALVRADPDAPGA